MVIATRDATVGTELPTVSKAISQPMINNYGRVNDDNNLMHYDGEFARARGFRDAIAHGLMTFGFVSEMLGHYFGAAWCQGSKVRMKFIAPVYPGDTVTACGRVTGSRPEGAGQRLTVDVWCENQHGQQVLIGEASAVVE